MAVNERVITTLFSSAQVNLNACVQSFSKILSGLQVTPNDCTVLCACSSSAARSTSVVSPERDINTTCSAPVRRSVSSGANNNSLAGTAVAGM